ncbi:MAG: S-layer homology domain-containing protein [Candidatus Gracilibacteria bacterium]
MNIKIKNTLIAGGIIGSFALMAAFLGFLNPQLFQASILPTSTGSSLAETGSGKVAVGVFYFPGWAPNNYEWNVYHSIKEEFPEREKIDGWEDMTTLASMDKEITWAKDHGVDYFIFDWYWDKYTKMPGKSPTNDLAYALEAFKKINNGRLKYTLLWCNHDGSPLSDADLEILTKFWEDNYFTDPDFMRTPEGKPFFTYWNWGDTIRSLSLDANGQNPDWNRGVARMQAFYKKLKDKFNLHIAVVADGMDSATNASLKGLETDAAIGWGYLNGNGGYHQTSVSQYEVFKDYAARAMSELYKTLPTSSIEIYPGILPGRNEKPWALIPATQLLQNDPKWFEAQLKLAYNILQAQPKAFQTIIIQSWNEMGEGAYLLPTKQWKFGALEALKKVKTCMAQHNCDLPALPDDFSPFKEPAVSNQNLNTNTISEIGLPANNNVNAQGNENVIIENSNTNTAPIINSNTNMLSNNNSNTNTPVIVINNSNSNPDPVKTQAAGAQYNYIVQYPTNNNTNSSLNVRPSAPKQILFRDISGHFAENAIKALFDKDIIQGRTANTFAPNSSLNRAEALKLVLAATNKSAETESFINNFKKSHPNYSYVYFKDVPLASWFASYIGYGFENKIIQGVSAGSYEPARSVTRAEFVKMVIEASGIDESAESKKFENMNALYFRDISKSSWYSGYIYTAASKKLIDSRPFFEPNRTITRGEAAKIIYSLVQ